MFLLLITVLLISVKSQDMGPYELRVEDLKPCTIPDKQYYNVSYFIDRFEEGGKTLLRWNITMLRRNAPLRVHFVMHVISNNISKKVYDNDCSACDHFLFKAILKMSTFKLDESAGCGVNKGFYYSTVDINADNLLHMMSKVMPYGEYIIRQEWYYPRGWFVCHEFMCRVIPLRKKGKVLKQ